MNLEVLKSVLPEGLLDHFDIVDFKELGDIEIKNDYTFIAEGSRLTAELSAFLKGTGRDPRRYDK